MACWPSAERVKSMKSFAVAGCGALGVMPRPRGRTTVPSSGRAILNSPAESFTTGKAGAALTRALEAYSPDRTFSVAEELSGRDRGRIEARESQAFGLALVRAWKIVKP